MIPVDVQITCSKVKVKLLVLTSAQYLSTPLLEVQVSIKFLFLSPPPLKQGAYCFALVGQSVFWSYVDQAMSAQYFLSSRLERWQTWYSGCHERVDVPYWFSGHIFKGEGQTAGLYGIMRLLYGSQYQGQTTDFYFSIVCSICYNYLKPFAW